MNIGIVDLDTSHPSSWLPIERELGHTIAGIYDGGAIHPAGYAQTFAKEHDIDRVFDTLDDMVEHVDVAIIHSCNWDMHVPNARPFIEAGKAVLIDKPIAGNLTDLQQFVTWSNQGHRIAGGSSLRYCVESRDFLSRPVDDRGTPHTVFCGCAVDLFNYGIHAYSMLSGIMGPGIVSVRHLGQGAQRRIQINFSHGRMGLLSVGATSAWLPFHATIVTERVSHAFVADSHQLYRALLESTLPYLAGDTDTPPTSMTDLIEPELAALAARRSWLHGDREVSLSELTTDADGYDGAAFAAEYRQQKYPSS